MTLRRLIAVLVIVVAVAACALGVGLSGATFSSSNQSTIEASTLGVTSLLHAYSHESDPGGWGGYYRQPGTGAWAATGVDGSLAVDVGTQPLNNLKINGIFTVKAEEPLPAGVTSISVRATNTADPSGVQPITSIGFGALGSASKNNPVTLSPGEQAQCNVTINLPKPGARYTAGIVLTVTYTGYTGSYYRYSVPFTVMGR